MPTAWAQFSPGPLSKAHASLAGPTHCTSCHALASGPRSFRCLSCHTDILQELRAGRGLHPNLLRLTRSQEECTHCHSDHNGEAFVPIRWDVSLEEFDHRKTGYALQGAHTRLKCNQCHTPEHIPPAERRRIIVKNLSKTYLGLSPACLTCHADQHEGELGTQCERCHSESHWKPATRFDHATAKFQLTGAHEKITCQKCHPVVEEPKPHIRFVGLQFSTCSPCHQDPHRAAFSSPCQACHSVAAWKPATTSLAFDHSRTKFPLEGKHVGVACGQCHKSTNFKEPVAHERCMDCHREDVHQDQFRARADGGDCAACHNVEGWKPSTFNAARHRETHYALEGRHAQVECGKCHRPEGRATAYHVRFERCADCHEDIHRAQFAGAPHGNRCEECHTVAGFKPSTFSLARHASSRFPLSGAHAAVPCGECHKLEVKPVRYVFNDRSCETCHQDPHHGQFRARLRTAGTRAPGAARCQTCHTLRTWHDLSKFDHSTTSFALAGSHRAVACNQCHKPARAGGGIESVVFRGTPAKCAGCHEDIHGGQFAAAPRPTDCGRCHSELKWKPSQFNHDRDSTFALTGAHERVECALCHTSKSVINGKFVLLYRLTSHECSSCHNPKIASR